MKTNDMISLISKIREKANRLIVDKMQQQGIEEIATSHGDIIFALFMVPKMTMAEVAERIGRDKSTVTVLVEKLVRLGYVTKTKSETDTRVTYVELTQSGAALGPMFEEISREVLQVFYKGVTEDEKAMLLKVLGKIHDNF